MRIWCIKIGNVFAFHLQKQKNLRFHISVYMYSELHIFLETDHWYSQNIYLYSNYQCWVNKTDFFHSVVEVKLTCISKMYLSTSLIDFIFYCGTTPTEVL
jgi:hypothetical protein